MTKSGVDGAGRQGGLSTLPLVTPASAAVVGNWNGGVATSGLAGADVVTLAFAQRTFINTLELVISDLAAAAILTVRMFHDVNGAEEQFYNEQFIVGTDTDSIPIIMGRWSETSDLRVEVFSDQGADDGQDIEYEVK